jgi:hypothetical protein
MVAAADHGAVIGEPPWWPAPPPRATERATLRRVVMATPSLPAAVSFFAGVLDGGVVEEGEQAVELVWPSSARVRLELAPDAIPGVVRLDLEQAGPARTLAVSGARFELAPR